MIKQSLFLGAVFGSHIFLAQGLKQLPNKIPAHLANRSVVKTSKIFDVNNQSLSKTTQLPKKYTTSQSLNQKTTTTTSQVIGHTYYELQSTSSVGDRIVVNNDGSIAAAWTMEFSDPGTTYPNRGTGYNYFNGIAWAPEPTVRVENARTGWGNIVNTRSGKELILSHNGGASRLHLCSRATKGSGAWANSTTAIPTATTGGNFWPRMVTSSPAGGDTIYAISLTYPVGSGGALWQGLDGAVVFSRSKDGGVTWDIVNQVPTGLTSANFRGFGGDAYAIAANGPVVTIVAGDSDKDVVMTKSLDGGVTWTSRTIYKCPITKWDHTTTTSEVYADGNTDTLETNDGTFAIALDNTNKAYVFFGRMRIMQDVVATTQAYSHFPATDGLYMWHEGMADGVVSTNENNSGMDAEIIAEIEDLHQQGTIYFPTPADPAAISPFGVFGNSLTSFPSASFDANNVLYLSYSSIVDSLISIVDAEKLVRHVYVHKIQYGGAVFGPKVELDKVIDPNVDLTYEGVYASMAKNVDGNVHIVYHRDFFPGLFIPEEGIDQDYKEIIYARIPTVDIPTGLKNIESSSSVKGLSFYPNPATSMATLDVTLNENTALNVFVSNNIGQVVYTNRVDGKSGLNKVNIDLCNFNNGIYFLQVTANNSKPVVTKFVVAK